MGDKTEFVMNDQAWLAAIEHWTEAMETAAEAGLVAAADAGIAEVRASFTGDDGPQNITGTLSSSVAHTDPVRMADGYQLQVGPMGVEYARRVELGKAPPHSAGPHPYLTPGWQRATNRFVDVFHAAWKAAQP